MSRNTTLFDKVYELLKNWIFLGINIFHIDPRFINMSINNNYIHRRGNAVVLGVDMWNWKERKTSLWELLVEWY